MKHRHYRFLGGVLCVVLLFALVSVCRAAGRAPENVNCDADIHWEIDMDAKVTQFDCALGKHEGDPALIFTVGIENVSDTAQRFRVNIFLEDMAKGAGYLVPRTRKGKPPAIEPGKSEEVKIPFIKVEQQSKKILVLVKKISY